MYFTFTFPRLPCTGCQACQAGTRWQWDGGWRGWGRRWGAPPAIDKKYFDFPQICCWPVQKRDSSVKLTLLTCTEALARGRMWRKRRKNVKAICPWCWSLLVCFFKWALTFDLDNCNVDKSRKTLMWKWCECAVGCCSKPVYAVLCVIEPGCICFKLKSSQSVTNIFSMKVKMIRIQNWICRRLNCPQIWGQLEKTTFRELLLKPNWFLDPCGKGTNWCELGLELVMRSCHAVIGSWGWSRGLVNGQWPMQW